MAHGRATAGRTQLATPPRIAHSAFASPGAARSGASRSPLSRKRRQSGHIGPPEAIIGHGTRRMRGEQSGVRLVQLLEPRISSFPCPRLEWRGRGTSPNALHPQLDDQSKAACLQSNLALAGRGGRRSDRGADKKERLLCNFQAAAAARRSLAGTSPLATVLSGAARLLCGTEAAPPPLPRPHTPHRPWSPLG